MNKYVQQSYICIINIEKIRYYINKDKRVIILYAKKVKAVKRKVSFKQMVALILYYNELGNVDL